MVPFLLTRALDKRAIDAHDLIVWMENFAHNHYYLSSLLTYFFITHQS